MANNRCNIKNKLILTVLIICMSISPVFASHVEIDPNSVGNQTEYFHAYNSNTNVVNSYIDSGQALFSKAMNYMFMNIAKSTSSVFAIKGVADNMYSKLSNSDTTLTNIATDIGLIKQSNVSQTSSLSSLLANSNVYLPKLSQISATLGDSTSGNLVDIKNALTNIDWTNTNVISINSIANNFAQNNPISANDSSEINAGTYYIKFNSLSYNQAVTSNSNLFRFDLPIRARTDYMNNFIGDISLLDPYGNEVPADYIIDYITTGNNQSYYVSLYISNFVLVHNFNYTLKIEFKYGWQYRTENRYIQYIPQNTMAYINFNEMLYLKKIASKNNTLYYDDSNIIDAINNLSLQDNDVKLNININNNTGSDGTNIIDRLQNFFNTGTSVSDFFDNVDNAESGWFTQTNSDIINTLSGGYVNLYE